MYVGNVIVKKKLFILFDRLVNKAKKYWGQIMF